eukprot:scaffold858_cov123-Cylindrotheca_fusiformis.AAC.41
MGEASIDIRLWFVALVIAFGFGRVDFTKNRAPRNEDVPNAPPETCKSPDHAFGQHLSLDMKGISSSLLDSEDSLLKSISDAADMLGLNLISSSCQKLSMQQYSCIGALQKAQISVQTWPRSSAIAVDLFIEGSMSLVPAVDVLKKALHADGDDIISFWSIDYRGESVNNRHTDLYHFSLNSMISKVKKELLSTEFNGHKLDIWELLDIDSTVTYEAAVAHNLQEGDPRWTNDELAPTIKDVYLDGQTIATNDEADSPSLEAFVHPGMMTQEHPKHIAILGGIASILSQILKHQAESVTFFQPEEALVDSVREFLPEIYNCSDLVGRADSCLDDKTVTWVKEAPNSWFNERYGETDTKNQPQVMFDVAYTQIALPSEAADLSTYVEPLMKALSPDGVLVISLGRAPTVLHPKGDVGYYASHEKLFRVLEELPEIENMKIYEEDFTLADTSREIVPRSFLVVCKSTSCQQRFNAAPEVIDSQLEERLVGSKSGKPVLEYYDGARHASFQVVPKAYESVYCRRDPMPFECAYRTLDFSKLLFEFDHDPEKSSFEISESGVFATVDIPEGSFIMAKGLAQSLQVPDSTMKAVQDLDTEGMARFLQYDGVFGHSSNFSEKRFLEIGPSHLIRSVDSEKKANIGRWFPSRQQPTFSPVYDRHSGSFDVFMVATKAIPKGGELLKLSHMWED